MNITNISVIINSKLGLLRDIIDSEINSIDRWANLLLNQSKKESLIRKERCEVCNSKEDYFQGHHISGRKHDHRQITVCIPCHNELSLLQKLRDKRWLEYEQSEDLQNAFFLLGLYDILILKSKNTGNSIYQNYASLLIEDISKGIKS